jgi:hypothetical protein
LFIEGAMIFAMAHFTTPHAEQLSSGKSQIKLQIKPESDPGVYLQLDWLNLRTASSQP